MKKIAILVGSTRKGSFTQHITDDFLKFIPENYDVKQIQIDDLPFYNEDVEAGDIPVEWKRFREDIGAADAFLFVTPEYNRSMPAMLKNALDVASRPYGENLWGQKPAAIVSVSPGAISGFGANHHLRQVATFLDIYMMQQPELYIGNVSELLNYDGSLKDESKEFLSTGVDAFIDWIEKF